MRKEDKQELTRLDRLHRLKRRAWERMWDGRNSNKASHWWAMWWYTLDDAEQAERWKGW